MDKNLPLNRQFSQSLLDTVKAVHEAGLRGETISEAEASKPVKTVKTKGGDYQVYKKDSEEAKSFRDAFAKARKEQGSGGKFTWQGREYGTKLAGEKDD